MEKPTDELNELLRNTKPGQLDQYFQDNEEYMELDEKAFYDFMTNTLKKKRIKKADVYSFACVSESYGGQIMRMEKHTRDRDLILRFCIAGHFTWDETNKALKLYKMNELYSKDGRDACILYALNNRIYSMDEIDQILAQKGYKKITPEDDAD